MVCFLWVVSCGNGDQVRSYTEVTTRSEKPVPKAGQVENPEPLKLIWETPESWEENEGSGLRRAWFRIPSAESPIICTLVVLQGNGGGLTSNVKRWLSQLNIGLDSDAEVDRFISRQEKFQTSGGFPAILLDFTELNDNPDTRSMLVSVISLPDETVFIKIMDRRKLLMKCKKDFFTVSKSLRVGVPGKREKT